MNDAERVRGRLQDFIRTCLDLGFRLDEIEQSARDEAIRQSLERTHNKCHTAKALGIHRNTVQRELALKKGKIW